MIDERADDRRECSDKKIVSPVSLTDETGVLWSRFQSQEKEIAVDDGTVDRPLTSGWRHFVRSCRMTSFLYLIREGLGVGL